MYAPRAEAPPALDASAGRVVVLDGDAVEAGAEVLVEAGHAQLRRHQLLRGNSPKERKMLDVAIICFESKSSFRETSAKIGAPGLVNFITAVAYHFCLKLPAVFTQPVSLTLADLCTCRMAEHPKYKSTGGLTEQMGHPVSHCMN